MYQAVDLSSCSRQYGASTQQYRSIQYFYSAIQVNTVLLLSNTGQYSTSTQQYRPVQYFYSAMQINVGKFASAASTRIL
jgi:hypothetical protein